MIPVHVACTHRRQLASEKCRVVSLTVTEKGYCQDVNGDLDTTNALVKDDLEGDLVKPKSAIGMIVAALRQRKQKDMSSFTVLSCDNLPENGDKASSDLFITIMSRVTLRKESVKSLTWYQV